MEVGCSSIFFIYFCLNPNQNVSCESLLFSSCFRRGSSLSMPGNQASPDRNGDLELKVSYMVKRSQGKSALGAVNFKKRVFVLTSNRLTYFDGTLEVCSCTCTLL